MATCKQCGKSRFFMSVDEKGLCPDCARKANRKETAGQRNPAAGKTSAASDRQQLVIDYIQEEAQTVQSSLISNRNCPAYVLRSYEKIGLGMLGEFAWKSTPIMALVYSKGTSEEWVREIHERFGNEFAAPIAANPNTPLPILREYYGLWQKCVEDPSDFEINWPFECLAANPGIPDEWRRELLECELPSVRAMAAKQSRNTTAELVRVVDRLEFDVRAGKAREREFGNLGWAFRNRNMTRDAVLASGFLTSGDIVKRCVAAVNPNLTEADLFSLLGDLGSVNSPSRQDYDSRSGYDQCDMAAAVVNNPSAPESVHRAIAEAFYSPGWTGFWPYSDRADGIETPASFIEYVAFELDNSTAARWTGKSRKTVYHFAESTDSRYSESYRASAFKNEHAPEILFAEPEKDSYIKGLARKHRENPKSIYMD